MRTLLPLLLLASCVGTHKEWRNPMGSDSFKADIYECEKDARVTGVVGHGLFARAVVSTDEDFRDQCMWSKGWEQVEVSDEPKKPTQPKQPPAEIEGLKKVE